MADLRETTNRLFDAMNNRDWSMIKGYLHPDYIYVGPDGEEARGIEAGLAAGWIDHSEGFPDGRLEIRNVSVDDEKVFTEFNFKGTHTGTWAGVAPTGRKAEINVCNVMEFRDGKLYRERDYLDTLGVFAQLGVVQLPS